MAAFDVPKPDRQSAIVLAFFPVDHGRAPCLFTNIARSIGSNDADEHPRKANPEPPLDGMLEGPFPVLCSLRLDCTDTEAKSAFVIRFPAMQVHYGLLCYRRVNAYQNSDLICIG